MSGPRNSLRQQDIIFALKLVAIDESPQWNQAQIAASLAISPAEVAFALRRLRKHQLLGAEHYSVRRGALFEFLVHGLKYVFPAEIGRIARGMPTGISHKIFNSHLRIPKDQAIVWPSPDGNVRGHALDPLYPTACYAAHQDSALYRLLALADALRVGGARETGIASALLEKALLRKGAQ